MISIGAQNSVEPLDSEIFPKIFLNVKEFSKVDGQLGFKHISDLSRVIIHDHNEIRGNFPTSVTSRKK